MKRFILIDAHALIHRAFHALPPLTTKSGELVNAVFGFSSILIKTIDEFKPEYIAAAFDLPEPTFRHKEYKEYKAKRPETAPELYLQIPRIKEVLSAFQIPIYEKSGYEADDIIGTISKKLSSENIEVLILTGDMDTLQLVGGNIKVCTPKRGLSDPIIYDKKQVMQRFEGLEPSQMNDFKGLKGDASDNIPGVKGIGEKTAINLLNHYKSIEKLYEVLEKGGIEGASNSVMEKLEVGKESAFFSKKLVTIHQDVPFKFSLKENEFGDFDKNKLIEVFRALGFTKLIERLNPAGETAQKQGILLAPSELSAAKIKYTKIPQDLSWEKLNKALKQIKEIYLSYQLNDNGGLKSLAIGNENNIYFLENNFSNIAEVLSDSKIKKTGFDFKSLIKTLSKEGVVLDGLDFDASIAAYVLDPGKNNYEIDKLSIQEFGEVIAGDAPGILTLEIDVLRRLRPILSTRLIASATEKVFTEIEMPLIPILAKMEMDGVKVDGQKLKKISKQLENKLKELEKEIYNLAGEEFNIKSSQQLAGILFTKLKITGAQKGGRIKKTPKGALSTNADELEKLKDQNEIIGYILKYRELAKLKSTYTDALPILVDKEGRIHTTFNQMATATGRLSSQDPNLQNIPARGDWGDEIRKTFVAKAGFKFVSIDYSQIHLRIIAALADDKKMIGAFEKGLDIHKFTASEVNNVSLDKVTPAMRFAAKELNFGIIYGMGSQGFADAANISKEEAKKFIDEYLKDFSGIARYIEELKSQAKENGFAVTFFGRRRYLPELNSPNYMLRSAAERIAINMPIQGLEADIMKKAMIRIDEWIQKEKCGENLKMLLQVHDELLFEIKEDLVEKVTPKIIELMDGVIKLSARGGSQPKADQPLAGAKISGGKVPIITETKIGDNWAELVYLIKKHA